MFDYINKILFKTKKPDIANINQSDEFVPYMVQRWCTMYSPQVATLVNETSNRHWSTLTNKENWFVYLDGVLPGVKFKRINYIKKKKEEKFISNKETIAKVANNLEISSREINQYIEHFNLKIPNEQHQKS